MCLRAAALRVLTEERIFLAEFDCEHVRNIPTFDWAFLERSSFTTFCHRKVAPKVSAGHLRRDRTKAVSERSRKTPLVARSLRAFHPLSDLLPPPVQCGGCCALHATMVYSDVILLYSIQQASGLPDRTAKIAEAVTAAARAPGAGVQNSAVFCARSVSAGVVTRYFSPCLIFWCFWIKPKAQKKSEIDSYFLWESSVPSIRRLLRGAGLPPFDTKRWRQKCPQGEKVGERPTACA